MSGLRIEDVLDKLYASFKLTGPRSVASHPPVAPLIRFIGDANASECEHMNKAKAKLRQEGEKLGANAILITKSKMKTSSWTKYPYMQMKADALVCDSVPAYMAWEIRAAK